ncbi:MAG: 4-demethylwyosine synthase TYW1 [Nanoarchaeota archaeon]|nr:4-demethylwyosine synthase TYW1 [Nanoarchaeota archaeon]
MKGVDRERLRRAGYRFSGNAAVEVCGWTKKSLVGKGVCYKQQFYGINCHRCIQMTPSLPFCNQACQFCWRDLSVNRPDWKGIVDDPKKILDELIEKQKELLSGYPGNPKADQKKVREAFEPKHVAISLAGEPTLYPKLDELIGLIKKRGMTSFLVTNGTRPEVLKKLGCLPTQLYVTLPAPNEKVYEKVCRPLSKGLWKKIGETLKLLPKLKTRKVIRLTLVKGLNMLDAKGYAKLIRKANPDFVECKAYMWVGFSRERLKEENMPLHSEIKEFSKELAQELGWKEVDEKKESRVCLLMKKDRKDRIMNF